MLLSLPHLTPIDRLAMPAAATRALGERREIAAGMAILAHAGLLAVVVSIAAPKPQPAADLPGFALVLSHPAPFVMPKPPQAAPAPPIAPPAAAQTTSSRNDVAIARPAPARTFTAAHTPRHAAPPSGARNIAGSPPTAPIQTASPAPASAPPALDERPLLATLAAGIDQAVRSVATMPPAARRQRREGRAQVRFSYQDGAVAEVALAQSSQSRLLDQAALDAVRAARYPAPPMPLRGRKLPMVLWIDFRLGSAAQG